MVGRKVQVGMERMERQRMRERGLDCGGDVAVLDELVLVLLRRRSWRVATLTTRADSITETKKIS